MPSRNSDNPSSQETSLTLNRTESSVSIDNSLCNQPCSDVDDDDDDDENDSAMDTE